MNHEFGVTIATSINVDEIGRPHTFRCNCVLDLRRAADGSALPISEILLKRLRDFRVNYEQMPVDMRDPTAREENDLYRTICEQRGGVLVVTDEADAVIAFCKRLDIPVTRRGLYLVDTQAFEVPSAVREEPAVRGQYARMAG